MKIKSNKGITLIALIITIIILLILAVVSINLVVNQGILERAKYGAEATQIQAIREELLLAVQEFKIDNYGQYNLEDFANAVNNDGKYVREPMIYNDEDNTIVYKGYIFDEDMNCLGKEQKETIPEVYGYSDLWYFDETDNSIYGYKGDISQIDVLEIPTYYIDDANVTYRVLKVKNKSGNILHSSKGTNNNLKLKLNYGLEEILADTFNGCTQFTGDLVIPNSVTIIENQAFRDCAGFNGDLVIGDGVTEVKGSTFYECSGFTGNLVIGKNVAPTMYDYAFGGCTGFTGDLIVKQKNAKVPSKGISEAKFKSLILKNTVETIEAYGFYGLKGIQGNLNIPNTVTTIGNDAFRDCTGFTGSLIIPDSVTIIENQAFRNCTGFNGDLVIGDGVTEIKGSAFYECSGFTGDLVIGKNVAPTMYDYAFGGCTGFTGDLIVKQKNAKVPSGGLSEAKFKSLILENTVETIETSAFAELKGISGDLIIPDSVTRIGADAFKNCIGFTGNLIIGDGVETIDLRAFRGCTGLSGDLVLGKSLNSIGSNVFEGNATGFKGVLRVKSKNAPRFPYYQSTGIQFENVIFESSVETIADNFLSGFSSITGTITIPNSVTTIGTDAFKNCTSITEITVDRSKGDIAGEPWGWTGTVTWLR